ncbi:hypothetical protein J2S53_003743 [Actinopolyspora lacussalsi]|nr:hypothetical protein [Actinopolyspora lacussalsi]
MRTTLRLDDDVHVALKERARREGRSTGQTLSELARQALYASGDLRPRSVLNRGFSPLPRRGAVVSNALVDQVREEESL